MIQMKGVRYFTPNMDTQPEFGEVLKKAKAAGVKILAYDCQVTEDSIKIDEEVPVVLEKPILWNRRSDCKPGIVKISGICRGGMM